MSNPVQNTERLEVFDQVKLLPATTCCGMHCFAEITEDFVFYAVLCTEYAEKSFGLLTVDVCVPLYPCISASHHLEFSGLH